jgi:hypothetical protein
MTLVNLNFLEAGILALLGFGALAVAVYFDGKRHHEAFLLFWAIAQTSIAVSWYTTLGHLLWANLTLDTLTNFYLAFAAFALLRGVHFDWNDRHLKAGYALLAVFMLLVFMAGTLVSSKNLVWLLAYSAPNMLMSTAAFFALGYALFREESATQTRWPILFIFGCYAILQPASYFIDILDPTGGSEARQLIRTLFAIGKFSIIVIFIAILVSFNRKNLAEPFVKAVQMCVWIISVGVSMFLVIYHLSAAFRI